MRHQKTQLILLGVVVLIHTQLVAIINTGYPWLNIRSLLWPTLVPCCVWTLGEMVKLKRKVDREDDPELASYFMCANFLAQDIDE